MLLKMPGEDSHRRWRALGGEKEEWSSRILPESLDVAAVAAASRTEKYDSITRNTKRTVRDGSNRVNNHPMRSPILCVME